MGRKARRTKWRTLDIADEQSDSEESNETSGSRLPKVYQQKLFQKFPYSSQSTPRRRYQHDGPKSTRSSSTASETKLTFNEDEYTRITTPRQDVLFKKGYLNKPKNFQSQTSTGTSTTSTGNSTGNGTPDHQSTDLEYESQFVFPNGFLDQNGIYYVNGYEPYPLMLYNPPTYYTEFSNCKTKRYSTSSLTESTSPNNEEATSQEMSGGEFSNNVSDYSGHHQVFNMVYPGYYMNGTCPSHDAVTEEYSGDQNRRIKKRRRRKSSRSQITNNKDSSECSEDESDSYADRSKIDCNVDFAKTSTAAESSIPKVKELCNGHVKDKSEHLITENNAENSVDEKTDGSLKEEIPIASEKINETTEIIEHISETSSIKEDKENSVVHPKSQKYNLKPDAEEFIPRAYRSPEIPLSPVQFIKVPPNFVPIPIVPFNGQNFNPAFIPPGIPVNFIPPDPKMFANFVGFVQTPSPVEETPIENILTEQNDMVKICDNVNTAKEDIVKIEQTVDTSPNIHSAKSKAIDMSTVVSKLEEAAKEQNNEIQPHEKQDNEATNNMKLNGSIKSNRLNQKFRNHASSKRNYYNSVQNSPNRFNGKHKFNLDVPRQNGYTSEPTALINSSTDYYISNGIPSKENNSGKYIRSSPEKFRKNWKHLNPNGTANKYLHNGINKIPDYRQKSHTKPMEESSRNNCNKHYSESLKLNVPNPYIVVNNNSMPINDESHQEKFSESPKVTIIQNGSSPTESTPTKLTNQWISVSSRKKRKNRTAEESDVAFEDQDEQLSQSDQFESYDVNLLIDVIPPSKDSTTNTPKTEEETLTVEISENNVEDIINAIAQNEPKAIENISLSPDVRLVTEIEKELIVKPDPEFTLENTVSSSTTEENTVTADDEILNNSKMKVRKHIKKGSQKPFIKRVIITDLDVSESFEEIKTPIKKVVCKIHKLPEPEAGSPEEQIQLNEDEEKKKNKKKKRKNNKVMIANPSLSGSSATLNSTDDSYDFLLDSSLPVDAELKTNDEISQELDKIIQKGMYSSLEEKFKTLKIDESDGFFKSVFSKISSRESNEQKMGYTTNGFTKTPDFTKILQSTKSMFKPSSVSQEIDLQNKTTNSILPDLDTADAVGIFLENPSVNNILQDQTVEKEKPDVDTTDKSERNTLYPITEAVKEWMSRTRETTPDVEILKSPAEIYDEFCDGVSDSESETEVKVVSEELSTVSEDEEITLFMSYMAQNSREGSQDILEYWEDDINKDISGQGEKNSSLMENINVLDNGEDAIEVYTSKYGENEDFLNLQREIQEKTQHLSSTRNSDLPHRAICCSIM